MMLGACRHTDAHNATSACELLRTRSRHASLTRSYLPEQVTTVLQVAADSECPRLASPVPEGTL